MNASLTLTAVGLTLVAVAGAVRRLPATARGDAWMFLGLVGAPAAALIVLLSTTGTDRSTPPGQTRIVEPAPPSPTANVTRGAWRGAPRELEPPSVRTARVVRAPLTSPESRGTEAP
jgi:hypothetical protein